MGWGRGWKGPGEVTGVIFEGRWSWGITITYSIASILFYLMDKFYFFTF